MNAAAPRRQGALWVVAALLLPVLVYAGTARSIVAIWQRSETYAHGFVIVPISLWLIWQRRTQLDGLVARPYQPCWPALAGVAACGAAWLLGSYGEVQIVSQYAFAAMLPLTVLALFGIEVVRLIAFPLLFLLLAVPFGENLIGPLMNITADLTVQALRASGIPVLREGNSFSIPSGNWSVVEACSGLRYLIASGTLGCLYAYLTYTTRWRQLLFVLLSIAVPVAANGVRAYGIVMIAHLSNMKLAVGIDHLIYGWLFFGLVMLLLFWIGGRWSEPRRPAPVPAEAGVDAPVRRGPVFPSPRREALAAAGLLACLGVWPLYAAVTDQAAAPRAAPAQLAIDAAAVAPFTDWKDGYAPPRAALRRFYTSHGQAVGLTLLFYGNQKDGSKLISSSNRLLPDKAPGWIEAGGEMREVALRAAPLRLRETQLAGPPGHLLVWSWYWIDGTSTASDYVGKLLQMKEKILTGKDDGVVIMIFSDYDDNPEPARAALRDFAVQHLPSLELQLARGQPAQRP